MIAEFQGDYRWLSNFWPSEVEWDGEKYRTVEHAYQAAKILDLVERRAIQKQSSPGQAKRLGRKFTVRPDWEGMKINVMSQLIMQKFLDRELKYKLLKTEKEHIQEGNYWGDTFWGVNLRTSKGKNQLGLIIMIVRELYREKY